MDGVGSLNSWTYDAYIGYSRSNGDDAIEGIPYFPRLEQTLSNTRFDEARLVVSLTLPITPTCFRTG
jgi:hypothetical protein